MDRHWQASSLREGARAYCAIGLLGAPEVQEARRRRRNSLLAGRQRRFWTDSRPAKRLWHRSDVDLKVGRGLPASWRRQMLLPKRPQCPCKQ